MEQLFQYLSAIFTRLLFGIHAVMFIYWLVIVKEDKIYFMILLILGFLVVETLYTVGFRKGQEYNL